jgi:hypothetical protein
MSAWMARNTMAFIPGGVNKESLRALLCKSCLISDFASRAAQSLLIELPDPITASATKSPHFHRSASSAFAFAFDSYNFPLGSSKAFGVAILQRRAVPSSENENFEAKTRLEARKHKHFQSENRLHSTLFRVCRIFPFENSLRLMWKMCFCVLSVLVRDVFITGNLALHAQNFPFVLILWEKATKHFSPCSLSSKTSFCGDPQQVIVVSFDESSDNAPA